MKIDFNQTLKQLDGSDILADASEPLTLGRLCTVALVNDETGDGGAKERRFRMAQKLYAGGEHELTSEDVAWLKEVVGRVVTSTIHAGQARIMLEAGSG